LEAKAKTVAIESKISTWRFTWKYVPVWENNALVHLCVLYLLHR